MRHPRLTLVLALTAGMYAVAPPLAWADGVVPAEARHVLVVGAGLRGDAVREDLLVPLTFSGPGIRLMLGYRGLVGPGLLAISGDVGGEWQGTPVISADWYNLSTTWKVDPDDRPRRGYGYQPWATRSGAFNARHRNRNHILPSPVARPWTCPIL
jgi:hypothetical protein